MTSDGQREKKLKRGALP